MYDSHPLHFMIHGPSNRITLLTISICKDDYRYTVLGNLNDKRILYPCGITMSATGTDTLATKLERYLQGLGR